MPIRTVGALTLLTAAALTGCAPEGAPEGTEDGAPVTADAAVENDRAAAEAAERPPTATDTLMLEGMPEPVELSLFRAPDDFPLPFSTYVPADMDVEHNVEDDEGASVHVFAEFGGVRNDRAFLHLFVYPEGTPAAAALGAVRAYEAGTGVPVSQGIEPLEEADRATRMPWADRAFTFRYQAGGDWYSGSIGLGSRDGRMFHLVRHYPAEYGDGFGPRAAMIERHWRWNDGTPLIP